MKTIDRHTALVVIDIQEKLIKTINQNENLIINAVKTIRAAKIFSLPIICTEQYPKGLGKTINNLSLEMSEVPVFEKTSFSCFGSELFREYLKNSKFNHLILIGIEAHVCVLQTVFDAIDLGLSVTIIADAVSSRREEDRFWALQNIQKKGADITTFESFFMAQLKDAAHPKFKEISGLLKLQGIN